MSQIPSSASIRARQAERRHPRCPVCAATDVSGTHVVRCEERERFRAMALTAGRECDVPDVTTLDLWAHASSRCHNEYVAALLVQAVLDLGWRPVVGSDPQRLWTDTEATS